MLVLLAAFTRAGIIATDLWAGANGPGFFHRGRGFADDVAALGRAASGLRLVVGAGSSSTEGARGLVHGLLRHAAQKILEGHQAGGAAEDIVANLGFDV